MHRGDSGDEPHDAQRAEDGQAADDGREARGDHAAEDEEEKYGHQGDGGQLGALLVLADGAGEFIGQRLQAGLLHIDPVDVEAVLDLLVVVQDGVVVVAFELDRHERVLLVGIGHVRQQFGVLEVADRAQNLVGMVLLGLVEIVENLLRERRIVDGLALGGGVDRHDVARRVTAVGAVSDEGGLHRLASFVVEAALGDMIAEAHAIDAATDTQRHHDPNDDVAVPVDGTTPPGEHWRLLT